MSRPALELILPNEARLEVQESIGLLPRFRDHVRSLSEEFDVTVHSPDTRDFSGMLGVRHRPLARLWGGLRWLRYPAYELALVARARRFEGTLRVVSVPYLLLPWVRTLSRRPIGLHYAYDYATTAERDFRGWKGWIAAWVERRSLRAADAVSATTPELCRKAEHLTARPAVLLPNFVDTRSFRPGRKERGLVVYAGRIFEPKGIDDLLQAFVRVERGLPKARLVLVGGGEIDWARARVRELGLARVDLRGPVAHPRVAELLGHAAAFVLPSRTREGHPKSLIEAMACGAVPIVTDVPGCRDLVTPGVEGIRVPPYDPPSLASALLKVLGAPSLAKRLSKNAVRRAAAFGREAIVQREVRFLRGLEAARA